MLAADNEASASISLLACEQERTYRQATTYRPSTERLTNHSQEMVPSNLTFHIFKYTILSMLSQGLLNLSGQQTLLSNVQTQVEPSLTVKWASRRKVRSIL